MASRFSVSRQVNLDSTGGGQVDLYPTGNGDWVIVQLGVTVATSTNQPTAKIYRNGVSPTSFVEGSYTGSNDSSDTRHVLKQGEFLSCVWSGGDAGARATMTVTVVQYGPGEAPAE